MVTAFLLFVGLSLGSVVSQASADDGFDADRSLIIYGGFGYFDEARLKWLNSFVKRNEAFSDIGRELQSSVQQNVRSLPRRHLERWTSHPVIFSSSDLSSAYESLTGYEEFDSEIMFREFDHAYMLVLTGNFEHDAMFRGETSDGVQYRPYNMVGVSVSLIDLMGQHEIVLSASDAVIVQDSGDFVLSSPHLSDAEWATRYLAAYKKAADGAMFNLFRLAERANPKQISDSWETYMVTGAMVMDPDRADQADTKLNAQRVEAAFDWNRDLYPMTSGRTPNACAPASYCKPGSAACNAMVGFMVGATSRALSQAGYKVMPPPVWQESSRTADQLARYNLRLPMSGLPELARSTPFTFDPNRASYKVLPSLQGIGLTTGTTKQDMGLAADAYTAFLAVSGWETDSEDCSQIYGPAFETLQAEGLHSEVRPETETELDQSSRQILYFIAINEAFEALARKLRK
ncbi:MAG: hypothetical protein CME88_07290 [Hirschia sp.]|nr:hypothetical protein [Hirschia sp.]